jgi:hypothetical protein
VTFASILSTHENALKSSKPLILLDFFGVSTDYLLGRSDKRVIEVANLTEEQIAHIAYLVDNLKKLN